MEIQLKAVPFDLAFHPAAEVVGTGLITGRILVYRYAGTTSEPQKLWSSRPHKQSCRGLRFVNGGQLLVSVSKDCSIQATSVETGEPVARLPDAHEAPINRVVNLTETTIATGDDDGTIKIWDTRQNSCCGSFPAHEDFVSDMEFVSDTMQLLSVGGDGKLCVSNLRKNRVDAQSEFSEDELLSVVRAKHGKKIVCGSQEGVLLLYSWGQFEDCNDRFVGHPNSVEALLKLDEDTLVSGSSDGLIRLVSILPNKITGVIGEHSDYPVERLAFSHDQSVLGSASHDNVLKLWDLKSCLENKAEATPDAAGVSLMKLDDSDEEMEDQNQNRSRKGKQVASQKSSFFADL